MNLYRALKGLDEMAKDWPSIKKSLKQLPNVKKKLKQLTGKTEEIENRLKQIETRRPQEALWETWNPDFMPANLPARPTTGALCKQEDFLREDFKTWCALIRRSPVFHRKLWEFVYIIKSLQERGMLCTGKRGLGFAVGTEPLPAAFASLDCEIVATDIEPEVGQSKGWDQGNQLCRSLDDLNREGICDEKRFLELCTYRAVDMNHIPDDLREFDFTWSSCSFEHLGSIEKGLAFLRNQMKTLKPGGWAVHTTEFNVSSNDETLEEENCVIFRQRDIERVVGELRAEGNFVEEMDYSLGWMPFDYKVDTPPYKHNPHLRLQFSKFVCTSVGIIIRKRMA